jgi:hypothetical protein
MSETKPVFAATLDRFADVEDDIDGVDLRYLPPFTILLVRTTNSLYRVLITEGPEVYVQGGVFFPNPTTAYLDGASLGSSCLKAGWIGVGLSLQLRSGDQRITTSRVRSITSEQAWGSIVH